MFVNEALQNHLDNSSSISIKSKILAEWNMNIAGNILQAGNYRYRPASDESDPYRFPTQSFNTTDSGNYYTNATAADILIDGGLDDQEIPTTFLNENQKEKQLYSLEDCF